MEMAELRLEEFAAWMRKHHYAESTVKNAISYLKTVAKYGTDHLSAYTRRKRRWALRLYQKFLREAS